jgi:uncharacterized membrane protein YjjB (DUF3815 family)
MARIGSPPCVAWWEMGIGCTWKQVISSNIFGCTGWLTYMWTEYSQTSTCVTYVS